LSVDRQQTRVADSFSSLNPIHAMPLNTPEDLLREAEAIFSRPQTAGKTEEGPSEEKETRSLPSSQLASNSTSAVTESGQIAHGLSLNNQNGLFMVSGAATSCSNQPGKGGSRQNARRAAPPTVDCQARKTADGAHIGL
jgi:hypothetical protein